jgi:hypothetical protein
MVIIGSSATVVGLISGVLGLVFLVLPGLKPDAAGSDGGARATSARLTQVDLEPRISRGQYLARTDQPTIGFTRQQLAVRGAFIRFRVRIRGFENIPLILRREVVDARTGNELSESSAFTITPPSDDVERDWHDWIPLTGREGQYFAIIKLLAEGEDAPLATLKTDAFAGLP